MSWGLALTGWAVAAWLLVRARRRRELVADAEHELRGALTAIRLALERVELGGLAALVGMQLRRAEAALEDLARGRRRAGIDRSAQLWANLVGNATEHGVGEVEVKGGRHGDVVRLEIRNRNRRPPAPGARPEPGRGRGLRIAARAAQELGGALRTDVGEAATVATVELPAEALAEGEGSAPDREGSASDREGSASGRDRSASDRAGSAADRVRPASDRDRSASDRAGSASPSDLGRAA